MCGVVVACLLLVGAAEVNCAVRQGLSMLQLLVIQQVAQLCCREPVLYHVANDRAATLLWQGAIAGLGVNGSSVDLLYYQAGAMGMVCTSTDLPRGTARAGHDAWSGLVVSGVVCDASGCVVAVAVAASPLVSKPHCCEH